MNTEQYKLQESLYEFPYHYTPHFDENGVGLHYRHLSWGLEYLCYLKHIQLLAETLQPKSVLDVGCGGGWFTRALADSLGGWRSIVGIDPDREFVAGLLWYGYPKITPEQKRQGLDAVLSELP